MSTIAIVALAGAVLLIGINVFIAVRGFPRRVCGLEPCGESGWHCTRCDVVIHAGDGYTPECIEDC